MLESIFADFRKLQIASEKVLFIENLKSLNLQYDIKYDNLIKYYENAPTIPTDQKAAED